MRWILRLFGVVFGLVALVVVVLFLLPAERIAHLATQQFEASTGRALHVGGTVRPSVWPVLGVSVSEVSLANADWSSEGPMLQAASLDVGVDLAALVGGDIKVQRMEFRSPRILLERHADGRGNWEIALSAAGVDGPAQGAAGTQRNIALERAEITDASVTFVDHGTGMTYALSALDAELRMPDFAGPANLSGRGMLGGQPLELALGIGGLEGFIAGRVVPLRVEAALAGTQLDFDGRAGLQPLAAEGRANIRLGSLSALMAALGQDGADLPAAVGAVSLAGQVTVAPTGSVHLREAQIDLGSNRLNGAADLTLDGPRPRLAAQLSAGALDFAALAGGNGGGGSAQPGWPREAIDVSALSAMDAEVLFSAASVDLGMTRAGTTRMLMTLDRARAVFDFRELRLFEGLVVGEFVVNGRSGLSVGGNLRANGLNLLPLLRETAGFERLAGTGDAELRFLGVGNSIDAIMRSLSGQGAIQFGRGEIIGFDLAGMLRTLDMSYMGEGNRTIFDSITGSFAIEGGVLRNEDLQLTATAVRAGGRGVVNLGAQTLDYRVTPVALAGEDGTGGLRVPLLVTGPWSEPRFRLDLEGLAEQRLLQERERLEALAREQASQAIGQQLGLEAVEGETLEGTARRALEESGLGGLLQLFEQ